MLRRRYVSTRRFAALRFAEKSSECRCLSLFIKWPSTWFWYSPIIIYTRCYDGTITHLSFLNGVLHVTPRCISRKGSPTTTEPHLPVRAKSQGSSNVSFACSIFRANNCTR